MATRTIGTEIVLSGEQKFNDAMKGVNNNLKNLRTDMALVSAEFDGNADSMEALTAKQKVLEQSIDQHKAKVSALSEMYKRQVELHGENSAKADTYRQQLTAATVSLVKEQNALKKTVTAMEDKVAAEKAAEELAKATAKAEEEKAKAAEAAAKAAEELAEAQQKEAKAAERAQKKQEAHEKAIERAKKATAAFAKTSAAAAAATYAAGIAATAALLGFAVENAEAAKAAQEAGETLTENQQQWLAFSGQLDALSGSAAGAKTALSAMLLPALNDLSAKGTQFLNDFTADMEAAAGDTEAQTQIMADYIVKGVELIREELPRYLKMGKDLILSLGEGLADAGAVDEVLGFMEDLIGDLLSTVVQLAPKLAQGGVELVGKLGMSLVENAPLLLQGGLELILGILQGIANGFSDIYNAGPEMIEQLKQSFLDHKDEIVDAGSQILDFVWEGILSGWSNFTEWFLTLWRNFFQTDVGNSILEGLSNFGSGMGLGPIPSPQNSGLSYVPYNGFLAQLHQGEMVLTREQAEAYRRGRGGGRSAILNVYVQQLSEGDINMLVDIINRKLGDDL